jgi:FMN phosphatase YigB (HAD superfamily)
MTLLIDADDTLWENIRVFNDVNLAFAEWVAPHAPGELIEFADAIQREMVGVHGYGAATFRLSLLESLRRHRGSEPDHDDHARVNQLVEPFRWNSVDLLPQVESTLVALRARNELVLMTKGAQDGGTRKVMSQRTIACWCSTLSPSCCITSESAAAEVALADEILQEAHGALAALGW